MKQLIGGAKLSGAIIFSLLFGSLSVAAKDIPIKAGRLTLEFQVEEAFIPKTFRDDLNDDWNTFCEQFSTLFLLGKGPQGRGIFNTAQCLPLSIVNDADDIAPSDEPWRFVFAWKDGSYAITLLFQPEGMKTTEISFGTIEFPNELTPDFLFSQLDSHYYVADRIYRRLPMGWSAVFNMTDIQWQLPPLKPQMVNIIAPTRRIGLYSLAFDPNQQLWIPKLFAVAQPLVGEDNNRDFDRDGSAPLELRWLQLPRQKKVRLWAQEIYSPAQKEAPPSFLTMQKGKKSSILEAYALEGLKSHSFSFRYGIPFPKGSTVVSQTSKVEVQGAIGKGVLDGLTLSAEFSPRLEVQEKEETYSFTATRLHIGWSFMLGKPQTIERFATRFRLTPKVGLISLDAYFPLAFNEDAETATVAAFKFDNQIDLGGELSWELESLNYRVKVWAITHLSGYALAGSDATKISNQRAGGDISYDLWRGGSGFRVGALAFGYIDWVTLQKTAPPELSLLASDTASGASYNVTYLGGGLSLSW